MTLGLWIVAAYVVFVAVRAGVRWILQPDEVRYAGKPKFGEEGWVDLPEAAVKPWRRKHKPLGTRGNPMVVRKKFW